VIAGTGSYRSPVDGTRRLRRSWRADLVVVAAAGGLVLAAAVVGRRLLADGATLYLPFPPLLAQWLPHVGPGTPFAVVVAAVVVARGPAWAERLPWRVLPALTGVAAGAWTLSLALVDGWQRGVVDRLTSADEYLHDVPGAPGLPVLLREFGAHILTTAVDPAQTWFWTTHVGAHPPGAFLVFVVLDRIGLGGGGAAGLLVIAVGASAAAAVLVAARAMGDEQVARRAAPFAVLFPGAVWVGVSADGLFAGVLAWGWRCSRSRRRGPAGARRSPLRQRGSCSAGRCTCRTASCSAACSRPRCSCARVQVGGSASPRRVRDAGRMADGAWASIGPGGARSGSPRRARRRSWPRSRWPGSPGSTATPRSA